MSSSSRYLPNYSGPRQTVDAEKELLISLDRITTQYPPVHTCSTGRKFDGFYTGPTSVAYMFYRISQLLPDLHLKQQSLFEWAEAYLALGARLQKEIPDSNHCGIANETLAWLSLRAAMTQDAEIVKEICSFEPVINRQDELGSDEWLYGRAGYLYFLRLCRATSMTWSTSSGTIPMLDRAMRKTVHRILAAPQPWTWHGKQYLGAAHGAIGIICQLVLTLPSIAPHLRPLLSSILTEQYTTGNFPSSENSGSDQLVQFCHGGPGFVISLRSLLPYYPDLQDTMIRVIKKAESDIWKRGLLTKEPCLCHGIAGNALALDDPDRFMHFLSFMSDSAMVQAKSLQGSTSKDKTAGLYTGEAGRSWTWAVASRQAPKTLIAYNDV